MKDPMFEEALSKAELSAWQSLKSVVINFLGNHRSAEYENEIKELLNCFRQIKARMSVKLLFLRSHLDYFPKNREDLSEETGEPFYQSICIMEECDQGQWGVNFHADNYCCLKRDAVAAKHWRKIL